MPPSTAPTSSRSDGDAAIQNQFAALFRPEDKGFFQYLDDVDPHDVSGERSELVVRVRCRTLEPFTLDDRTRGRMSCSAEEIDFDLSFSASALGLFWQGESTIPIISSAGFLTRAPYAATFDAGDAQDSIPCTRVGEPSGERGYCSITRCKVTMGYGDTVERLCIDERGLVEYETENLEGPRYRRLARVAEPNRP